MNPTCFFFGSKIQHCKCDHYVRIYRIGRWGNSGKMNRMGFEEVRQWPNLDSQKISIPRRNEKSHKNLKIFGVPAKIQKTPSAQKSEMFPPQPMISTLLTSCSKISELFRTLIFCHFLMICPIIRLITLKLIEYISRPYNHILKLSNNYFYFCLSSSYFLAS